jgi:anti-anti-sigma factor
MAAPPLKHLRSQTEQGILVLTLTDSEIQGEGITEDLRLELLSAVAGLEGPRVVLDFHPVQRITTVCLRALLNFRRHIRDKGGQLLLCNLAPQVAELLFTTRLASPTPSSLIPFAIAPDVKTAIAHLSNPTSQR